MVLLWRTTNGQDLAGHTSHLRLERRHESRWAAVFVAYYDLLPDLPHWRIPLQLSAATLVTWKIVVDLYVTLG